MTAIDEATDCGILITPKAVKSTSVISIVISCLSVRLTKTRIFLIRSRTRAACFSNIVLMYTPLLISRIWNKFEKIKLTCTARCYTA
jgi:hypothetical protein